MFILVSLLGWLVPLQKLIEHKHEMPQKSAVTPYVDQSDLTEQAINLQKDTSSVSFYVTAVPPSLIEQSTTHFEEPTLGVYIPKMEEITPWLLTMASQKPIHPSAAHQGREASASLIPLIETSVRGLQLPPYLATYARSLTEQFLSTIDKNELPIEWTVDTTTLNETLPPELIQHLPNGTNDQVFQSILNVYIKLLQKLQKNVENDFGDDQPSELLKLFTTTLQIDGQELSADQDFLNKLINPSPEQRKFLDFRCSADRHICQQFFQNLECGFTNEEQELFSQQLKQFIQLHPSATSKQQKQFEMMIHKLSKRLMMNIYFVFFENFIKSTILEKLSENPEFNQQAIIQELGHKLQ